jgi:hypothetical protein
LTRVWCRRQDPNSSYVRGFPARGGALGRGRLLAAQTLRVLSPAVLFAALDPGGLLAFSDLNQEAKNVREHLGFGLRGDTSCEPVDYPWTSTIGASMVCVVPRVHEGHLTIRCIRSGAPERKFPRLRYYSRYRFPSRRTSSKSRLSTWCSGSLCSSSRICSSVAPCCLRSLM